jgi:hypothetical protein
MNSEIARGSDAGTRRVGLTTYATACGAAVAVLLLSNWPTYQFAVRDGPIPLYYYLAPALMIVPVFFAEPGAVLRWLREPIFWWFATFVLTGLLWLLLAQDIVEDASRQWRLRALSMIVFLSCAVLAAESQRRVVAWVIVGCMLAACAFNWFDVLRPYRFVPQGIEGASDGRGAGLFINPNAAGSFIVMAAVAALPMIPSRLRGLLLVSAVFGVAATFSRGAFVMVFVALAGSVWLKLLKRAQGLLLVVALPLLVGGVSLSYDYLIDKSENRHLHNIVQRLNWFQDTGDEDIAVEGRKFGARQAWQIFLENPLTGKGTGATSLTIQQEGPHNMYLLLMAEQGMLGLALYVSLWLILMRQGRRIARSACTAHDQDIGKGLALLAMYMATYGFFSHNVLEEPHTMFLLAFAAAAGMSIPAACSANLPVTHRTLGRRATSGA